MVDSWPSPDSAALPRKRPPTGEGTGVVHDILRLGTFDQVSGFIDNQLPALPSADFILDSPQQHCLLFSASVASLDWLGEGRLLAFRSTHGGAYGLKKPTLRCFCGSDETRCSPVSLRQSQRTRVVDIGLLPDYYFGSIVV